MMGRKVGWLPRQLLAGHSEPIFRRLPGDLIANLRRPRSENALVWNLLYPLARPGLSFQRLCALRPLHGTPLAADSEDLLVPYFWGWSVDGDRLEAVDEVGFEIDGVSARAEADVILLGRRHLVLLEAKRFSRFGRCGRYLAQRCPEVHRDGDVDPVQPSCRYWTDSAARFDRWLDFGPRPDPLTSAPPCSRHYQLARLFLLGRSIAERLARQFHLWAVLPRGEWARSQADWRDFVDRVLDEAAWRRARVLAWEDLASLGDAPPD